MEYSVIAENISKNYGTKKALDHLSILLPKGKIIGVVGPNGAGKTTFIKCMAGLIKDYTGTLTVENKVPGLESKKTVAYLPDRPAYEPWMKVEDVLHTYVSFYSDFNKEKALSLLEQLEIPLKGKIKKLSKGEYERMQLVFTMSREATVYLLDEPIAGVDPLARTLIIQTILANYSESSTLIISTHLIEDIETIIDEVVFIDEGKVLISGSADEIRSQYGKSVDQVFREVFKC